MRLLISAFCVAPMSVVLAAGPAAPDPWAKVPKFPTVCYSSQDTFTADASAAMEAVRKDIESQKAINDGLTAQLDALDPSEKMSRMQSYLMEHPQEAAKVMEAAQAQGAGLMADLTREGEEEKKFQDELKGIQTKYEASLTEAQGPLFAQLKALGISEKGTSQATWDAGAAIMKKINAEYERVCPAWWGAAAPFHGWLKRYKEHLIQNHVDTLDNVETAKMVQFTMFSIPADNYRPTDLMESVVRYMDQSIRIFDQRVLKARSNLILLN